MIWERVVPFPTLYPRPATLYPVVSRSKPRRYPIPMVLPLIALAMFAPKLVTLVPKETVWVYANASTPGDGTFLRAWGVEGKSCPPDGEDAGQFSFSYLKWDLSELPTNAKIVSAKLLLNNTPEPGYTADVAKKCPIEVRPLIGDFDAKKWTFDMSAKNHPDSDEKAVFGTGFPATIPSDGPVPVTVNLMTGPNSFLKAIQIAAGSTKHTLNLAITAKLDPSTDGRSSIYKFFGQNDPKEFLRPQLVLTIEE